LAGVFVVGSINQDFVLKVDRRPKPGETVTDAELALYPGGKGANQAIAAARLGAEVAMLGKVGEDPFGGELVENLRNNGVNTSRVEAVTGAPTGSAFITLTPDGENAIVVSPGANRPLGSGGGDTRGREEAVPGAPTGSAFIPLTPDGENAIVVSPGANRRFGSGEVEAASEDLREARLLLAQLEVGIDAVETAARIVNGNGGRFLLNLAPPREVSGELLRLSDPLVVNEHEAAFLLEEDTRDPEESADKLLDLGPPSAIVTLGGAGAIPPTRHSPPHAPAPQ